LHELSYTTKTPQLQLALQNALPFLSRRGGRGISLLFQNSDE
jgi:hypothetical protein